MDSGKQGWDKIAEQEAENTRRAVKSEKRDIAFRTAGNLGLIVGIIAIIVIMVILAKVGIFVNLFG